MRAYRAKGYNDMSRKAADIISAEVTLKLGYILGLATDSSPIGICKQLIGWYEKGDLDFSQTKSVSLDEYKGLTRDSDQGYYYFMYNNFFKHINIDLSNISVPDETEPDSEKECSRHGEIIESMDDVDLQLLDLGRDGHIGFNEPEDTFPKLTHYVDLQKSAIEANKRFFADINDIPKQAYTMGIQAIMRARTILMVVSGEDKARVLHGTPYGPITPHIPASTLQLHNDVIIVADEAALSKVPK